MAPALAQQPSAVPPKPDWMIYRIPYGGESRESTLANPHRTSEEIVTWAQQAAADILSFSPADYRSRLGVFKKYFVAEGWLMYAAYLKGSGLISRVAEEGYSSGAIVNEPPDIVRHGATDGVYRWAVRMPVTISFFAAGAAGGVRSGTSEKHILLMDLERVTEGGDNGVAIDSWHMDEAP